MAATPVSPRALGILAGWIALAAPVSAQPAYQVVDLDPGSGTGACGDFIAAVHGEVYYGGCDGGVGGAIYRSDGTPDVAVKVADLGLYDLVLLDGVVILAAGDSEVGVELRTTDGTPGGTTLVKDIYEGPQDSIWSPLTVAGSQVFFWAEDGVHGRELWVTDGTEANTVMVRDFNPGPGHGIVGLGHVMPLGDRVVLVARDGSGDENLWISDGTQAGTVLAEEQVSGPGGPRWGAVGDLLVFGAGTTPTFPAVGGELWASDGTVSGTSLLKDLNEGSDSCFCEEFAESPGQLFFVADGTVDGGEVEDALWRSDGTAPGTRLVKDLRPGFTSERIGFFRDNRGRATRYGAEVFFGSGLLGSIWRSNGSEEGTSEIEDGFGFFLPHRGAVVGGVLYFVANHQSYNQELWRSDGTAAGTELVLDICPGPFTCDTGRGWSGPQRLTVVGDMLFFLASDGTHGWELWAVNTGPCAVGQALWLTDRTVAGEETFESCRVRAGTGFTVAASGRATLRADHGVVIQSGFTLLRDGVVVAESP